MKKMIIILLICFPKNNLFSQKFSSKFYTSPILINPANTGRFIGGYRVGGVSLNENNALSQDSKSFFSLDFSILQKALIEQDELAIGVAALSETDHYFGLKNNSLLLSLAYFKGLDEEGLQKLGVGFQTSFSTKKLEPPSLIFPDQIINWANSGFTGVGFGQRNAITVNYLDFNAGIIYQNLINYKYLLSIGMSVLHTTRPHIRFDGGEFTLSPEVCFQVGLETSLAERDKLLTNFTIDSYTDDKGIDNYSVGCIYQMNIGQSIYKISGGSFYRNDKIYGSVIAPCLGLKFNNFNLNISYNIDLSKNTTTQKKAFELGLIFIGKKSAKK